MGLCGSSLQTNERSKNIDLELKKEQVERAHKILLLGPGESGKSTFLKQLIELYADQKNSDHPEDFKTVVYGNIILSIKTLIKKSAELEEKFSDEEYHLSESSKVRDAVAHLKTLKGEEDHEISDIDGQVAQEIRDIWTDPAIQKTYKQRSMFQLHDSAKYYFDKIRDIGRPTYVPTVDDIIRCRIRTLGVNEVNFNVGDARFSVIDVGGQRSERNKWIHCFEKCSVLIFFAAASEYDQFLYEDEETNRMDEALGLFEQLVTSRWFKGTKVILFLNKVDLFKEKLQTVPLSTYLPDCTTDDYESCCKVLENKFASLTTKTFTTHLTSVTNGSTIEQLFEDVMTILLREQLKERQLL